MVNIRVEAVCALALLLVSCACTNGPTEPPPPPPPSDSVFVAFCERGLAFCQETTIDGTVGAELSREAGELLSAIPAGWSKQVELRQALTRMKDHDAAWFNKTFGGVPENFKDFCEWMRKACAIIRENEGGIS